MPKIESKILLSEMVENQDRKFGSALEYYPVYIEDVNGETHGALFTCDQIEEAIARAEKNQEDVPEEDKGGLFGWLFD